MPLTTAERKHRLPHGARRAVATALHIDPSYVTKVVAGEAFPKTERGRATLRRVQVALARKLALPVDEAFPPITQHEAAPEMATAP